MSTPLADTWRDVWGSAAPAGAPEERRGHLEVVATRSQRKARPRAVYAIVAVASLMGIVVAQLLMSIAVSQGAYELDGLTARQMTLQRSYQAVTESLDTTASPQSLAAKATALGMVANPNLVYLRLSDGAVLGSPAPAPAAGGAATDGTLVVPNALLEPAKGAAGSSAAGSTAAKSNAAGSAASSAPDALTPDPNVPFVGTLPSPTTR
ncbi:hypothetical protein OSC27_04330 [Microbacterium sp. STN6]|uniref:hypothetical protein n=1 Tax=Microbacterium sp. STN6 TaxID=2995588 RepID=UPI00226082F1|nr:hypothetical protein [Microbacterium sp. STN6]MCX7521504.1 hypothetical protein [Microbacterium sp. STN6]